LGFVFSLVALLGGMWIYIFQVIRDMTVSAPADVALMPLGYAHWLLTVYFGLALYVLYQHGLMHHQHGHPATTTRIWAQEVLLRTWPVSVAMCLVSFVAGKVIPGGDVPIKVVVSVFGIGITALAFFQTIRASRGQKPRAGIWWFWVWVVVLAIPFMLGMSMVLADVDIRTDREFYRRTDDVVISMRASGYMFRPSLKLLQFGRLRRPVTVDETVVVGPADHNGDNLIRVDYEPQVGFSGTAFHEVRMEGK
jgi:hypothetical protein